MNAITVRRMAAWSINRLLHAPELSNMGNLAMHFDGDVASEWAVVSEREVRALKEDRLVAEVFFNADGSVEVVIADIYQVVRPEHLSDFDPGAHNILPNTARDVFGQRLRPDLHSTGDLGDIPGLDLPERPMPRYTGRRQFKVEGSLG